MIIASLLLLPLLAAFLSPVLAGRIRGNVLGWVLAIVPLLMLLILLSQISLIAQGFSLYWSVSWFKAMNIAFAFRLDGLSQLLVLMISGIGFPIVIYSTPYFGDNPYLGRYYILLFIFMMSMTAAVLANDLVTLYIFWEMTSICSFLLIGINHQIRTARSAAIEALFITSLGGLALLASFILLSEVVGSQQIDVIITKYYLIKDHPYFPLVLILFLIGVFTKSAQFPFSFWLPAAMKAPTPVSAYLHSATMVQLGIYLLARFHPLFAASHLWLIILTAIGGITMLTSVVAAARQLDMKLMLAYTTVTALGSLVFILAGNHDLGIKAAVSFLLVHALYKANLFMAVGDIQHQARTRHLKNLGGLHRVMPITFLAVFVAGLSMAGMPPLLGFYIKELVYEASLLAPVAYYLMTAIVVFSNMIMATIAFTLVLNPFWGKQRPSRVREANINMSVNSLLLALVTLFLSLFTGNLDFYILSPATEAILGHRAFIGLVPESNGMGPSLILSMVTLSGAALLYIGRDELRKWILKGKVFRWMFPYGILQIILGGSIALAKHWTSFWQSGYLHRYIMLVFISLCLLFVFKPPSLDFNGFANSSNALLWLIFCWLVFSAASLFFVRRVISGIIALSVFGLGLAFYFVTQAAPDVALTQVLVETMMIILIVFSFSSLKKLPDIKKEKGWSRGVRTIIATGFGALVALTLNGILSQPFNNSLGRFYIKNSLSQGHGRNVVNVILVDFRALDTLGEVVVVMIAAFGIYSLLHYRSGAWQ